MTDKTIKKILLARDQSELVSDSDIEDFARANRIKFDDILRCLANHTDAYKPCWLCEHIADRCYPGLIASTPCATCSRRIQTTDNFKPAKGRFRMNKDQYDAVSK